MGLLLLCGVGGVLCFGYLDCGCLWSVWLSVFVGIVGFGVVVGYWFGAWCSLPWDLLLVCVRGCVLFLCLGLYCGCLVAWLFGVWCWFLLV